jgi:hypothetical protein
VALALAVGLPASCTGDPHRDDSSPAAQVGKNVQRHPVRDSLLSNVASTPVQDVDFRTLESRTPQALTALARFPEEDAVGELEGDSALVLGKILDATIVPAVTAGTPGPVVALLDGSYGNVRLFTTDGTPESGFGSFGQGPGEVRAPVALAADDDAVVVLDAALKIERFGRRGPSWQPLGSTRLTIGGADVCAMDPGLVVLGPLVGAQPKATLRTDPQTVHVVDRKTGEVSTSFSAPYRYDDLMALWEMVKGRLACDRGGDRIWVAYSVLHEVHALDLDGRLLWITRLSDLVYPDLVETTEGGRISIHEDILSTERIEQTTHITRLGRSLLAVQVESYSMADLKAPHPEPSYRTYFLDAATGRGVGAIAADHQILAADGTHAVLYRQDPFPQFAVVTLGSLDER